MLRTNHRSRLIVPTFLLCLCSLAPSAHAASKQDHWIGTWAAAPMAAPNRDGKFGSADITYREIVHISLGGSSVRILLSNELGTDPLTINAASIALSAGHGEINPEAAAALTFSGSPSIVIPAGGMVVSDPASLKLPPFADVAVSFFVPAQTITQLTTHSFGDQTSYTAPGNVVSARTLTEPTEITSWPILKGINVLESADSAAIVTFGDSITDGAHSTPNTNARWPDVLARRLQADKKTANLAVLNEGIGGNRILHDVTGPSALARFDRDVLAQAGVEYLIIMEGINDIGHAMDPVKPYDVVSAQDIIAGLTQLATRAHMHGIKVIGATLTPYVGAKYQSPAGEQARQAVNQWIRTTKDLDGVVDFDKATVDPANPGVFAAAFDSGDHLHPGDAGYKAMGDSIDLNLFKK
jgi:lysophospholipase L1-like esterase